MPSKPKGKEKRTNAPRLEPAANTISKDHVLLEKTRRVHEGLAAVDFLLKAAQADAGKGNRSAFVMLLKVAEAWNYAIENVADAQPELAKNIAKDRSIWPGNVAGHPAAIDDWRAFLQHGIALGSDLPNVGASSIPWRGRKRLDSPAQAISIDLWDWLVRTRKKGLQNALNPWEQRVFGLPHLVDKKSLRKWFDCAWSFYESAHEGDVLRDDRAAGIAGTKRKGENKPGGYVKDQVYKASHWWLRTPAFRR